jgi:hypothetical protein
MTKISEFGENDLVFNLKHIGYRTSTESKENIWKFINLVKPMKWVYNKNKIQKKLEDFGIKIKDIFVHVNMINNKQNFRFLKRTWQESNLRSSD